MRVENAKIKATRLGVEDHGCMTADVLIEGDGWGGWFSGYVLDTPNPEMKKRVGTAYGMQYIMNLMEALGVNKWEDLAGDICACGNGGFRWKNHSDWSPNQRQVV